MVMFFPDILKCNIFQYETYIFYKDHNLHWCRGKIIDELFFFLKFYLEKWKTFLRIPEMLQLYMNSIDKKT